MKQNEVIRVINNAKVGGMLESGWTWPGLWPFSDNDPAHVYPVLTQAMAAQFVGRVGDMILNPDVEVLRPPSDALQPRITALEGMVKLIRAEQRRRGFGRKLIIPFGLFPRDDASVRACLPVFRECGCAPVGGYISNSPNRQQWGVIHGSTLTQDMDRNIEDAERIAFYDRRLFRQRTCKIILWIHDHYIFPDYDAGDPFLPEGQVGGWGTERALLDEAVEAYDRLMRRKLSRSRKERLFDGYQYWNEPGAPIDGRLIQLGGAVPFVGTGRVTDVGRVVRKAGFDRRTIVPAGRLAACL